MCITIFSAVTKLQLVYTCLETFALYNKQWRKCPPAWQSRQPGEATDRCEESSAGNGRRGGKEVKTLVIYDSQYGNTKLLAEDMAHELEEYGEVSIVRAAEADSHIFGGEDLLVVGGPTQGHGLSPDMKRL